MSLTTSSVFFEHGTHAQFEFVLSKYEEALEVKARHKSNKPETLIKLDKWYQNELPKKIKSRGKEAHLVHDELVQTIKWKLARGVFRPRLKDLVQMNTPRLVMQETKKAFRYLQKKNDLEAAVSALSNLKGVGPAMASAVLAAGAPETAPFMADECLLSMPDMEGIDYTMKEYMKLVQKTRECCERLNSQGGEWTPHKVELAVWTHYVARELKPELLEGIPGDKDSANSGRLNGSAGKEELNGVNGEATEATKVNGEAAADTDKQQQPPAAKEETKESESSNKDGQDKDSPQQPPADESSSQLTATEPAKEEAKAEEKQATDAAGTPDQTEQTSEEKAAGEKAEKSKDESAADKETTSTTSTNESIDKEPAAPAPVAVKENGTAAAENGKSEDESMEVEKNSIPSTNGESAAAVNGKSNGDKNGSVDSSEDASNTTVSAKEVADDKLSTSGPEKTECQKRPLDSDDVDQTATGDSAAESEPKRLKPAEDMVGPPAIPAGGE